MTDDGGTKARTGIFGYDLSGVRSLIPDVSPFQNPPTEAERAESDRKNAEWRAMRAAAHARRVAVGEQLAGLPGVAGKIAAVHRPTWSGTGTVCDGCDFGGYEGEAPDWPCRTVTILAEDAGIALPPPSWEDA